MEAFPKDVPDEPSVARHSLPARIVQGARGWAQWLREVFLEDKPGFWIAVIPMCLFAMLLFTRHPRTNFIFDEQEALLANPYVRSVADLHPKFGWLDAWKRDFWGLGPERSIGSYRPIPNVVWRALWAVGFRDTPFLHHWVNVVLHGLNGALVVLVTYSFTKRRDAAWLAGLFFTGCAVLTEAVSGVVGIADVLGGMGALLGLYALTRSMPVMGLGVFAATLFGLWSKESALSAVPLLPVAALLLADTTHAEEPRRWARAAVALVAGLSAFVLYVELRRRWFPAAIPQELAADANAGKPLAARTFAALLRWYAQPTLPKDPLNNPLVGTEPIVRIAGALRVFFRGLGQTIFPWRLSGDYSSPQEPAPTNLVTPEIVLGALAMVLPFVIAPVLGVRSYLAARRAKARAKASAAEADVPSEHDEIAWLAWHTGRAPAPKALLAPVVAVALLWVVLAYFPVSNIPVLLPTVRAERFWYTPAIGTAILYALVVSKLLEKNGPRSRGRAVLVPFIVLFLAFQGYAARAHANDYTDDLVFWDATRHAVPRSAKAHLNYSVMKGARGDLHARLEANRVALELAPNWAMANVYYGDTLCRLHRAKEAWPHYKTGFSKGPNDSNLIALGLQCMWDEKALGDPGADEPTKGVSEIRSELAELANDPRFTGSWLAFLGKDILQNGEEHGGVAPKYRPRGYNEGPKD